MKPSWIRDRERAKLQAARQAEAKAEHSRLVAEFTALTGGMTLPPASVRDRAESVADVLSRYGFETKIHHSGSIVGSSSYVYFRRSRRDWMENIRVSDHSNGGWHTDNVDCIDNYRPVEVARFLASATMAERRYAPAS